MSKKKLNPPAPHPRPNFKIPDLPPDHESPFVKELIDKLDDTIKDIHLNWGRLNYQKAETKEVMLMIEANLRMCKRLMEKTVKPGKPDNTDSSDTMLKPSIFDK